MAEDLDVYNDDDVLDPDEVGPPRLQITKEFLDELKQVDIANYPIPEKYTAAYKMEGKQRLMIQKMVLENFKSYYGKQVIGPYHPHFSAIIGANGSGKSNIIDSLMFVFGSKVSKIRSANIKALIHKSANHQDVKNCSVSVHFVLCQDDKDGKQTYVPGSEFVVRRTGTLSGTSKYYYNDEVVKRDVLRARLQEHGIDMDHNRFLILQGEVEQISLMKPKTEKEGEIGLLEYLDDIIGTSRLKAQVTDLEGKRSLVENERELQLIKVDECRKLKDIIRGPVMEMLKIVMLENRTTHCRHRMLIQQVYEKEQSLPDIQETEQFVADKKKELEELLATLKERKKSMGKHHKELDKQKQVVNEAEKRITDENLKLQKVELAVTKTRKRKEDKQKEIVKEEKKIQSLTDRPEKNNTEIEELKVELEDVKATIQEKLPELQERLAECQQKTDELNNERNKVGEKLAAAREKEDQANAELTSAQSKRIAMTEEIRRYEGRIESAQEAVEQVKARIEAKTAETASLERQMPALEREIKEADSNLKILEPKELALSDEYARLKDQYNAASADCSSNKQQKHVLQMLMREKENGNIPGVYGRLGNLGAIDPRYDAAISTTCPGLDMIVCDTYNTVQKCLKFIEENKLSRTTFIAIDKISYLKSKMNPIRTPEDAPRLFDLVTCNREEIRYAFYFCLRDTLVVDNIVNARRISTLWGNNQRFRVVTLDGNVVDPSGTITGGGGSVKRGRIGTNVQAMADAANPEELRPRIEELKNSLEECRTEISKYRNIRDTKTRQLEQSRLEYGRCLQVVESAKCEQATSEATIRQFQQKLAETNVNEEELLNSAKQIEELKAKRNQFSEAAEKIKCGYDEISKKIDAVYDQISGTLKKEVDERRKRQTEIEAKIKSLRTAASKAEIDLKKSKEKLENMQQAIVDMDQELEQLEESKEGTEREVAELSEFLEGKKTELEEIKARFEAATAETEGMDEQEINLKREIKNGSDEVAKLKEKTKSLQAKIAEINSEIEKLKCYDIREILADKSLERNKKTPTKKKLTTTKSPRDTPDNSDDDGRSSSSRASDYDDEEEAAPALIISSGEDEESSCELEDDSTLVEFRQYSPEEIECFDPEELKRQYNEMVASRKMIKIPLNLNILDEYRKRLSDYLREQAHLEDLTEAAAAVHAVYDRFINQRLDEFADALQRINDYLRNQYYALSLGGEAYLQSVSPMDPYAEGIKFIVRPKAKGWREIAMTSGGEKTISSLSLVFALHQFLPTPFYVMDEIDAALDYRNVAMISKFVKEKTKNSQFIIISLRDNMYQQANSLIGVYKVNDKAHTCLLQHQVKRVPKKVRKRRGAIMPA